MPNMTNAFAYGRSLTPAEAYAIDVKFDDGMPMQTISNYSGHGRVE